MLTASRSKQLCTELIDQNLSPDARCNLVEEVRDSLEIVHSPEYGNFLNNFLPVFRTVLFVTTAPQFEHNTLHRTRAIILDIISRLPANETFRSHLLAVFNIAIDILRKDNEDNAVTAIRIIFDLYKSFRAELSSQAQSFLDFVRTLYGTFGNTVDALLTKKSPILYRLKSQPRFIPPSNQSFRVVTECPLLVLFVFNLRSAFVEPNMAHLCPLMVRAIEYEVPTSGMHDVLKSVYQDFIASQVKTVSFLAYLLKQPTSDYVKADPQSIPRSVVKLLQACPDGFIAIRKELLVAARLILTSNFRDGFVPQVNLLLDERVLLGEGCSTTDTLRPLAYSFLAELVHHVRFNLTIPQLNKIIYMFSTNVHDSKFTYALQTSSIRLLMNLIEGILKIKQNNEHADSARELLVRILETMVNKYVTLGEQVPRLLKAVEDLRDSPDPVTSGKRLSELPAGDPLREVIEFKTLLKTLTQGLKTVIWSALKTRTNESAGRSTPGSIVPVISSESLVSPVVNTVTTIAKYRGLGETECELIATLLPAGQKCFRLFSRMEKANGGSSSHTDDTGGVEKGKDKNQSAEHCEDSLADNMYSRRYNNVVCATVQEEREILEQFGQVFTVLDVPCFQDIFGLRMGDLFEHLVSNPQAIMIPQHFLANPSISKYFADILLNFLVDNLNMLDVPTFSSREETLDGKRADVLLKLYRIMFAVVNLFPSNEPVLRLHVSTIVRRSLKFAASATDPHAYLQLLRFFFKVIGSGKQDAQFEVLFREFSAFIEPLFQGLMDLYNAPSNLMHRDQIIELCLIVPARPSTIFPHLELQMKFVIWSLRSKKEITATGFRALEFWIDMLQPAFLSSLLSRVEPNLFLLLEHHVQRSDGNLAKHALRILGKLGMRGRCYKPLTSSFEFKDHSETAQQMLLTWSDGSYLNMITDKIVSLSVDILLDRRLINAQVASWRHKAEVWRLLFSLLISFFGIYGQNESQDIISGELCFGGKVYSPAMEPLRNTARTKYSDLAEESYVICLLTPLLATFQIRGLHDAVKGGEKSSFNNSNTSEQIQIISRYFAALCIQEISNRRQDDKASISIETDLAEEKGWRSLSPSVFTSALIKALSFEEREFVDNGVASFRFYLGVVVEYCTGQLKHPQNGSDMDNQPSERNSDLDVKGSNNQKDFSIEPHDPMNMLAGNNDNSATLSALSNLKPVAILPFSRFSAGQNRTYSLGEHVMARHIAELIEQLSHCCHCSDWTSKRAGVFGFEVIFDTVPELYLRTHLYMASHLSVLRSLMFVTRGAGENVEKVTIKKVRNIIGRILEYCFFPGSDLSAITAVMASKHFKDFLLRLGWDLPSEWPCTRNVARECIEQLAVNLKVSIFDLLTIFKDHLFRPLFQRSVRLHPLAVQIGYIDCFNFFLQKGKEKFTPELFSRPLKETLLSECIIILECTSFDVLTETEEGFRYKPHEHKFFTLKNTQLLLTLRRKVIGFLCNISVYSTELADPTNDKIFRSIIASFFKCLQSGDEEIVRFSKVGLKQAISKHPKPKEILQDNLRPILAYLADYKRLSIQYLQSLSRVLELFWHWFHVGIGDRLLEHLQRWTEPEKFGSHFKLAPGTESKIGAAILDLFHLLPPAAEKFLPQIVPMVIKLESVMPAAGPGVAHLGLKVPKSASTSPYRAPLLRYCNRHVSAAVQYFLQNLNDDRTRQLLFVMVRTADSAPLRKELIDSSQRLLSSLEFSFDNPSHMPLHIISLIDLLTDHDSSWLNSKSEIMPKLDNYWQQLCKVPEIFTQTPLAMFRVDEMKAIANIFTKYCSRFPDEVWVLFELLLVFLVRTVYDFSFVKEFLKKTVTRDGSTGTKKLIVTRFLDMFKDKETSQERKVHALQYLVIPMVSSHLKAENGVTESSQCGTCDGLNQNDFKTSQLSEGITGEGVDFKQPAASTIGAAQSGSEANLYVGNNSVNQGGLLHAGPDHKSQDGVPSQNNNQSVNMVERDHNGSSASFIQDPVLDSTMIQRIMKEILDQPDDVLRLYDEPLSAELLQLATLLIRYLPRELGRYRKELIKFGWGHLKREESTAKHWAFVNVTTFFEAYPAPGKIILQVYVALLRACQSDGRDQVQRALDILTPALPRRLIHNPSEHRFPIWIRYTKKILLEEAHNSTNLVHILQLIVRHYSLFFVARSQFVPIMTQSLNRIGLNSNALPDTRRLCVDLVAVIINWEQQRRFGHDSSSNSGTRKRLRRDGSSFEAKKEGKEESGLTATVRETGEPPNKSRKGADGQALPSASSQSSLKDVDSTEPSDQIIDALFSFLAQVPFRAIDRKEGSLLLKRCLKLIEEASSLWAHANVNLAFIERFYTAEKALLSSQGQKSPFFGNPQTSSESKASKSETKLDVMRTKRNAVRPAVMLTALSLMSVLTKYLREKFVNKNIGLICFVVKPALTEGDLQTASQCCTLLKEVLQLHYDHPNPVKGPENSTRSSHAAIGNHPQPFMNADTGNVAVPPNSSEQNQSNSERFPAVSTVEDMYGLVHDAIDKNLKALDSMRTYYALVALQIITNVRPYEFVRHQDNILNSFRRYKDRLISPLGNSSPSGSGPISNAGSLNGLRTSKDASASNSTNVVQGVSGKTEQSQSQTNGHEHGRSSRVPNSEKGSKTDHDVQVVRLALSLLGTNISTLENSQKKALSVIISSLLERSSQVPVPILLEIVKVVGEWVFYTPRDGQKPAGPTKEPLATKEKVSFLHKLVVFERLPSKGANQVMRAFLHLILRIFGGEDVKERRPELVSKLERVFLLGLKSEFVDLREKFFALFTNEVGTSLSVRINFLIAKQDWEPFGNCFWIRYACEFLIAAADSSRKLVSDSLCARFPRLMFADSVSAEGKAKCWRLLNDKRIQTFVAECCSASSELFLQPLRVILHFDSDIADALWTDVFPKIWGILNDSDRGITERALSHLLSKEYHQLQVSRPLNNVKTILESVTHCKPLPVLQSPLLQYIGSRWNAWHISLAYLEKRRTELHELFDIYSEENEVSEDAILADIECVKDSQTRLFRMLEEDDYFLASWKQRANVDSTRRAASLLQCGRYREAMDLFANSIKEDFLNRGDSGMNNSKLHSSTEFSFWEEGWIKCARNLCQWDVLTEYSRVVMNHELMHECLWRVPEWSGLKELLLKHPIEDGPQLKLYEAYLHMQENKMEATEDAINQGIYRAIERYRSLPISADMDSKMSLLVNFQKLIEVQESTSIFEELNSLSGQSSQPISVDQKVDSVRMRLNTWRERLPSIHEPLRVWSDILTWRNHMHAVIVNVLENLREAASARATSNQPSINTSSGARNQTSNQNIEKQAQSALSIIQSLPPQVLLMGINETAWNVHRFARAARKQGFSEVSLHAMSKMYPFGTMDLTEYFVKTKEMSRSFLARPEGLDRSIDNGLFELNRCNMEHFSPRQRAQLFTVKAKLLTEIGREEEAADALRIALNTSSDVGSTWLAWGKHCDKLQTSISAESSSSIYNLEVSEKESLDFEEYVRSTFKTELAWREAATNCYMQAIRFGSRNARPYLCRVLRLVIIDVNSRCQASMYVNKNTTSTKKGSGSTSSGSVDSNLPAQPAHGPQPQSLDSVPENQDISKIVEYSFNTGVSRVISSLRKEIPTWMWIPWLSQIICMLARKEAVVIRPILMDIAQQYPQALFFLIRSFAEERRTIDKPTNARFTETLKEARSFVPPLQASAALQAAQFAKQLQFSKENIQKTSQRIEVLMQSLEMVNKSLTATQDPAERAKFTAKQAQLKKDCHNHKVTFDKHVSNYKALQYRHRHLKNVAEGTSRGGGQAADRHNIQDNTMSNGSIETEQKPESTTSVQNDSEQNVESKVGFATTTTTPFEHADSVMTQIARSHQTLTLEMERMSLEFAIRLKPQREEHLLSLMSVLLRQCYRAQVKPGKPVEGSLRTALSDASRMCFRTGIEGDTQDQKLPNVMLELKKAFENELAPQVSKNFPKDTEEFIERLRRWQNIFQRRVDAFPDHMKLEHASKLLLDIKDSDVEIFGQYIGADNIEPAPDRHVKIQRFGSKIKLVQGPVYPCRGLSLLGSDGCTYEFALETSVSNGVQAAEERTVQMYRLLNNWVFNKDAVANRKRINLWAPILVPTGQRTRLTSLEKNSSVVEEGLEKFLKENGKAPDMAVIVFRNVSSKYMERKRLEGEVANETGRADLLVSRVLAYKEVCDNHVPDTCLADWVNSRMLSWNHRFMFQKRFAETLGASCLSSYFLGCGARRPQSMTICWSSGSVSNMNGRVLTTGTGKLESNEAVPFRLTRNIVRLMEPFGFDGPFIGSMTSGLSAIRKNTDLIQMWTELVLRDELKGWVSSKLEGMRQEAGRTGSMGSREIDITSNKEYVILEDRLRASLKGILQRIGGEDNDISIGIKRSGKNDNINHMGSDNIDRSDRGSGKMITCNDSEEKEPALRADDGESRREEGSNTNATEVDNVDEVEVVANWIERARKIENLVYMECTWQPWY